MIELDHNGKPIFSFPDLSNDLALELARHIDCVCYYRRQINRWWIRWCFKSLLRFMDSDSPKVMNRLIDHLSVHHGFIRTETWTVIYGIMEINGLELKFDKK